MTGVKKFLERKCEELGHNENFKRIFFDNYENKTIELSKKMLDELWEEAYEQGYSDCEKDYK